MKVIGTIGVALAIALSLPAQHNDELYNNGAVFYSSPGSIVNVWGDVHMLGTGGQFNHNGTMTVQGHMFSDSDFQQSGTGIVRLENSDVNVGQVQFIEGSYAVRGGQSQIGVDDGSFYDLQLANDQGIVWLNGNGNVADVRNTVDFFVGAVHNRIITDDPGSLPTNGSAYSAVFGNMNTTTGIGTMTNNTVSLNGNMSGSDVGYIQGKFRRAISAAGGQYDFVLGLEPAGAGAARGLQYARIDFAANNYDVVTGYFQNGSVNPIPGSPADCGYNITYFGGGDHGEWVFDDVTGSGTGLYELSVWPQDDNMAPQTVWMITKDDTIAGLANDCGASTVGLSRSNFNGFSEFGVAGGSIILQAHALDLKATAIKNEFIRVKWNLPNENEIDRFEVERSYDNIKFEYIGEQEAIGSNSISASYELDDRDVIPGVQYWYRIRTIDANSEMSFSHSVEAMLDPGSKATEVVAYPNPLRSGDLNVDIHSFADQELSLRIFDAIGRRVYAKSVLVKTGLTRLHIPGDRIAAGSYMLKVTGGEFQAVRKLVKMN